LALSSVEKFVGSPIDDTTQAGRDTTPHAALEKPITTRKEEARVRRNARSAPFEDGRILIFVP
jgi:hypothetical protein